MATRPHTPNGDEAERAVRAAQLYRNDRRVRGSESRSQNLLALPAALPHLFADETTEGERE